MKLLLDNDAARFYFASNRATAEERCGWRWKLAAHGVKDVISHMLRIEFDRKDVKEKYDRRPPSVGPHAAMELLGLATGAIAPQVASGSVGLHRVTVGGRRELVLGLDRRRPGVIRIILIEIRRRKQP